MVSSQISAWINQGGSFKAGLRLLQQTTSSRISYFEQLATKTFILPEEKAKLAQELQKFVSANHQVATTNISRPYAPAPPIQEPIEIQQLRARARKLHKQEAANHNAMSLVDNDQERYSLAVDTMENLRPALDQIYAGIKDFERTGKLPVISAEKELRKSIIELVNKKGSIRSRLSVLKKKLSIKESPKLRKEYEEKQILLQEIEDQLNYE